MKMLIVDDNKDNIHLLEIMLKGSNYNVVSATDGIEALEKLHADGFDIIVSDILMPGMDGFQLCREVKEDEELKDIPFVFYTATYTDGKDEAFALSLGGDRFVRKPIEPDEFMEMVQGVVRDAERGKIAKKKPLLEEEKEVFKLYSERLVAKLEQKMVALEAEITERKGAEEALRESEKKYRLLAENVTDVIFVQDMNFNMTYISPSVTPLSGYSVEEALNKKMKDFYAPDSYAKAMVSFQKAAALANTKKDIKIPPMEYEYVRKDGSTSWGEIKVTFLRDSEGRAVGVQGVLRDISERKRAEELLQQTANRVKRLHKTAHDLELCKDEDQVYRLTVEAAERTLSFSVCTICIVEEDRLVVKATSSAVPSGASRESELKEGGLAAKTYRTKETTVFGRMEDVPEATPVREDIRSGISAPVGDIGVFQVASTKANAFTDEDARLLELLLSYTAEAVKRIHTQKELEHQAIHDPLTGAYNRRYFDETIETELQRSRRYNHPIGFLMIDIDRFKEINDTFGHQMGDKVLQTVASVLHEQVRENDLVVRYGGDEFLIALIETNGELQMITKRIQQTVAKRNKENPLLDFPVTLSIGAAHWEPKSDLTIEQVLAKADERMYEEKKGKSTN
jgi:diguanylate cyclase (GGDEF)-like protein/PAS domain S-box-containing protein